MAKASDLPTLVRAGADGDEKAWHELVHRYAHLVVAVTRQYRLSAADAQDVSQTVWLRLVEHLADIREPAALAGWIITTAKHECLRLLRSGGRTVPVDPLNGRVLDQSATVDMDGDLVEAERQQALRDGLAELAPHQRELLVLLATDPPPPYAEISRRLGIPIGSIGPTRSRILDKLRATTAIRTYLEATREAAPDGGGRHALAELE
ncbi:MAG TPA: sigma-70 family RNA polymerase sigma factor [Rugosimonospora sp.]|nr:sigma-70 family RNA polymerase sigma factor [Rugosimonospora sp.]